MESESLKPGATGGRKLTAEYIDGLVARSLHQVYKVGTKTAVLVVTLPNGFEITETSACIDPANFDLEIGRKCCLDRVKDKVWLLEGYLMHVTGAASTRPVGLDDGMPRGVAYPTAEG